MPRKLRKLDRAERHRLRLVEVHKWKLALLRDFVERHGWRELRKDTTRHGVNLFPYVRNRRTEYKAGTLADWLVTACEAVPGWSWDPVTERHRRMVDDIRVLVGAHGPDALATDTLVGRVRLSHWAATRRHEHRRGVLAAWLGRALEAIPGWSWDPRTSGYEENLAVLRRYAARHSCQSLRLHTVAEGVNIGKWASHIRQLHRRGSLPAWLVGEVEALEGWSWEPRAGRGRR